MVTTTASIAVTATLKDNASRGLRTLGGNVNKLSGGAAKASAGVGGFSKSILGINPAAAAAAVGIAALGAAAVKGIKDFAEFEKTIQNVTTLLGGDAAESAIRFQDQIAKIATVVPKSANELGAGFYDILSAGISEADGALNFLEQSSKLATAGLSDTSESVDLMTSAFNAFKSEGLDANQIADVLFKTVEKGKTTVSELARSFGQVAPVASAAGVSFNELQAATAALTTQGIRTSQAQQGLKAAFSNVIKPSSEAAELAAQLGLEFNSTALASKGLSGFLVSVKDATGGNIDTMAKLFGSIEGLNAVLALTSDTGGQAFIDTLDAINNSAGATEIAFQKQTQTFSAQFQLLKSTLFQAFLPALRAVNSALTTAASGFIALINSAQGIGGTSTALNVLKQLFAPTIALVKGLVFVFKGLVEGLKPAIGFMKALAANFSAAGDSASANQKVFQAVGKVLQVVGFIIGKVLGLAVTGLIITITALSRVAVVASQAIGKAFQSVGRFFSGLFSAVKNAFGTVSNFVGGVVDSILNRLGILGDAIRKIVSFGKDIAGSVASGFKEAGAAVVGFFSPEDAVAPVREATNLIKDEIQNTQAALSPDALGGGFEIPAFESSPLEAAVANGQVDAEIIKGLETQVASSMTNIGQSVTSGSQTISTALIPLLSNLIPQVIGGFKAMESTLKPVLKGTLDNVTEFTKTFLKSFNSLNVIPNFMTLLIAKTTDVLSTGFTAAYNSVIDITNLFTKTMVKLLSDSLNAVISVVNSVVDEFNAASKILSQDIFRNVERRVATDDGGTRIVRERQLLFGGIDLPELSRLSAIDVEAPQAARIEQAAPTKVIDVGGLNINIENLVADDEDQKQQLFEEINRFLEQRLGALVRL